MELQHRYYNDNNFKKHLAACSSILLPSDGVDWDSGGELGCWAPARRDILSQRVSRFKPCVPIHLHCPDPPHLTVDKYALF